MKKGFTVVELIVSIVLATSIAIFLLQLLLSVKDVYEKNDLKTQIINKQSLITKMINTSFDKIIYNITKCGSYCVTFEFSDGDTKDFIVSFTDNTITIGNYKTKLPRDTYIKDARIDIIKSATFDSNKNNAILKLSIVLKNDELENDFEINGIYQFNTQLDPLEVDFSN